MVFLTGFQPANFEKKLLKTFFTNRYSGALHLYTLFPALFYKYFGAPHL